MKRLPWGLFCPLGPSQQKRSLQYQMLKKFHQKICPSETFDLQQSKKIKIVDPIKERASMHLIMNLPTTLRMPKNSQKK